MIKTMSSGRTNAEGLLSLDQKSKQTGCPNCNNKSVDPEYTYPNIHSNYMMEIEYKCADCGHVYTISLPEYNERLSLGRKTK